MKNDEGYVKLPNLGYLLLPNNIVIFSKYVFGKIPKNEKT